ncbi:MAG: hypothetical protein KBT41_06150, partial [bacterium]|nr:hypothetical protein [Candidatus Colousia faecequi]
MKQKHLLRPSTWLKSLLLMVVMAISGSVYAQDATFDLTGGTGGGTSKTDGDITVTFNGYENGADIWSTRKENFSIKVTGLNGATISKIEFELVGNYYNYGQVIEYNDKGEFTYNPSGTSTWIGEASEVTFIGASDETDVYVTTLRVWLAAPVEPVTYTVNIVGAPEGAAVTLDGKTMADGNTYTVAKNLTTNDLIATETADYYAEKTYDEANHTFTVTYKEYLKYDVAVTGTDDANAGVVYHDVTYHVGDNVPAKTELISTDVTAAEVAGLEGTV